jgi:hypothetical protein
MLIKLRGILEFSPEDVTRKHKAQSSWKRVAIIKTDCDLDRYYAWFLSKRFNLEFVKNLRGPHITFINDKMEKDIFEEGSKIWNGKEIDFYIDLEPKSSVAHWWLRVFCPDAEIIREALGLSRDPYYGFHLTLGHVNDKNIEHSRYIINQCKRFNLISSEPTKPLEEYDILDCAK